MRATSEYAARGLVGVLPPQANTTVEAELGVLLPPDTGMTVARLTCRAEGSRERLIGYYGDAAAALRRFDTARPDVALFACTGSTYLVGLDAERREFARLDVPIISAAQSVLAALEALGARRLALLTPYPDWLTAACIAFWRTQGREIGAWRAPEGDRGDTRRIYALGSSEAIGELARLDLTGADAVLVAGTGMPSLGAILWHTARSGIPILSSNLCLAWCADRALARAPRDAESLRRWLAPDAPWRERLAVRFPAAAAGGVAAVSVRPP